MAWARRVRHTSGACTSAQPDSGARRHRNGASASAIKRAAKEPRKGHQEHRDRGEGKEGADEEAGSFNDNEECVDEEKKKAGAVILQRNGVISMTLDARMTLTTGARL